MHRARINVGHAMHRKSVGRSGRDEQEAHSLCSPGGRVHLELKHVVHGTVAAYLHRLGVLLVFERILHATRGHKEPVCHFEATRLLRGASKSNCHLAIAGRLRSTTCVPRAVVLDAQAVERAGADLRKPHCQHGIVTLGALLEDLQDGVVRCVWGMGDLQGERSCRNHGGVDEGIAR